VNGECELAKNEAGGEMGLTYWLEQAETELRERS